jgi:hypothetical protein
MKTAALLLLWTAPAWTQAWLTDLLPPEHRVVIGINARAIIDSAVLPNLNADPKLASSLLLVQKQLHGLDPLKDVDSVLVVITGDGQTPPGLAIVRGHFDAEKLGPAIAENKDPKNVAVLLDSSTLIAGDEPTVRAVMESRGKPHKTDAALVAKIDSMSSRFDVWGLGDVPKGFAAANGASGGLEAVDHFEFGASFRKGLTIEAQAHVRSSQDSKKMSESLQMLEKMFSVRQTSSNGGKFSLTSQNGTFKLSLVVSEEELKKAIAAQKASIAKAFTPAPKPTRPEDVKIVSRPNGDTFQVILPGGK